MVPLFIACQAIAITIPQLSLRGVIGEVFFLSPLQDTDEAAEVSSTGIFGERECTIVGFKGTLKRTELIYSL